MRLRWIKRKAAPANELLLYRLYQALHPKNIVKPVYPGIFRQPVAQSTETWNALPVSFPQLLWGLLRGDRTIKASQE
jgi:hypothetical protein